MGTKKIIAIDLGKFKSVACVMDATSRQHTFETVPTTPSDLHDLLVRHLTPDAAATHVVIETCSRRRLGARSVRRVGRGGHRHPRQRRTLAVAAREA